VSGYTSVTKDFIKRWAEKFPAILTTKRAIELVTMILKDLEIEIAEDP